MFIWQAHSRHIKGMGREVWIRRKVLTS